ncbi:hypothetical protein JST97_02865 [bacterium]|nr:hypothetical protein [bacterium]
MNVNPIGLCAPRPCIQPARPASNPEIPADRVELSSSPGPDPVRPPASSPARPKVAWLTAIETSLAGLSGPVGPVLRAVLDVWSGRQRDSCFEHSRHFADEQQAREQFERSKASLLNPNQWKELGPTIGAAGFKLFCDDRRKLKQGPPEVGDFLKIRLPDLGPAVWCRIERLDQQADSVDLVVRPSPDPLDQDPDVAHFFSERTTNHFQLVRDGNRVFSRVIGRDEALNDSGDWGERLLSALRLKGAWLGAKKPQWRAFTRKLLQA